MAIHCVGKCIIGEQSEVMLDKFPSDDELKMKGILKCVLSSSDRGTLSDLVD